MHENDKIDDYLLVYQLDVVAKLSASSSFSSILVSTLAIYYSSRAWRFFYVSSSRSCSWQNFSANSGAVSPSYTTIRCYSLEPKFTSTKSSGGFESSKSSSSSSSSAPYSPSSSSPSFSYDRCSSAFIEASCSASIS